MAKVDVNEMSFLDHLEDLRWHLIRATLGIFIAAITFNSAGREFQDGKCIEKPPASV